MIIKFKIFDSYISEGIRWWRNGKLTDEEEDECYHQFDVLTVYDKNFELVKILRCKKCKKSFDYNDPTKERMK